MLSKPAFDMNDPIACKEAVALFAREYPDFDASYARAAIKYAFRFLPSPGNFERTVGPSDTLIKIMRSIMETFRKAKICSRHGGTSIYLDGIRCTMELVRKGEVVMFFRRNDGPLVLLAQDLNGPVFQVTSFKAKGLFSKKYFICLRSKQGDETEYEVADIRDLFLNASFDAFSRLMADGVGGPIVKRGILMNSTLFSPIYFPQVCAE